MTWSAKPRRVFFTSFRAHGAPVPAELDRYFPTQPDPGPIPVRLVQVVPGGYVSATQATRELIDSAQRRLDIVNPYLTDADIIQRSSPPRSAGSSVRVVVSENVQQPLRRRPPVAPLPAAHRCGRRESGSTRARWSTPRSWSPTITVSFGTVNFDAWALYRNYEVGMMARSAAAAKLFEYRVFDPDIARSHPGKPPTGLVGRLKAWFWDQLAYFL